MKKEDIKVTICNYKEAKVATSKSFLDYIDNKHEYNIYTDEFSNSICYVSPILNVITDRSIENYKKKLDSDLFDKRSYLDLKTYLCLQYTGIVPKLIVPDELKEFLLSKRVVEDDGAFPVVQFGEYISKVNLEKDLVKRIFAKENSTGETFTLQDYDVKNVYEYQGKKYIYEWMFGKIVYEIKPYRWHLKMATNELVSDTKIISNMPIDLKSKNQSKIIYDDYIDLVNTPLYKNFLNGVFLDELVKNELVFQQKKTDSEVLEESLPGNVVSLKKKISEIKNLIPNDPNKYIYERRLTTIVDKYNSLLDSYEANINNVLKFDVKDIDTIIGEISFELDGLKEQLEEYNSKTKEYKEMLAYLDKIDNILETNTPNDEDEFLSLISQMTLTSLTYVNDAKIFKKVLNLNLSVLNRFEINKCLSSIMQNGEVKDAPFINMNEFILSLRSTLQPILFDILEEINKKSICDDIKENIKNIQKSNIIKSNNRAISLCLGLIEKYYNDTLELIGYDNVEIREELDTILNEEVNYSLPIEDVLRQVNDKYYRMMRIYNRESIKDNSETIKTLHKMHIGL